LRYGTDEMVALIQRTAARVARVHPGSELAVADLSAENGGPVARHRSHQSGRDVDLIYYAIDRAGDALGNDGHMPMFVSDGRATHAESPEWARHIDERFFDLPRNWALVQALATDPMVPVYRIFVSRRVRNWLFAYAEAARVAEPALARVRAVLSVANHGHSDHLHVRISCSADDIAEGRCSDAPAPRRRRGKWRSQVKCGPDQPPRVAAKSRGRR
jgi:penicillin-insensitive murein endopeptidase